VCCVFYLQFFNYVLSCMCCVRLSYWIKITYLLTYDTSVPWRCWLGGRKGIRPVKTEWWDAGVVICLERGADLHMTQLMTMPLTVSCFSKIQIGFTFLVPAHPGSPGQKAIKRVSYLCSSSGYDCDATPSTSWRPCNVLCLRMWCKTTVTVSALLSLLINCFYHSLRLNMMRFEQIKFDLIRPWCDCDRTRQSPMLSCFYLLTSLPCVIPVP